MPVPIPAIAGLLIGGGLAARELSNRAEAKRARDFAVETTPEQLKAMLIAQAEARQAIAAMQEQPATGAQKATAAPKAPSAEEPVAEQTPPPPPPTLEESGLAPGEVTELPVLPMRDLAAAAPYGIEGWSVTSEGKVNYQIRKDTSAMGAQFNQMFENSRQRLQQTNPEMPPLELDSRALSDAIRRSGMLPPQQVLNMLNPEHREKLSEQVYWSAMNRLANDPAIRRSLSLMARQDGTELTPQALDAAVIHYAMRAVANDMGGFIPEDVREQIFNLEGPPISAERMQMGFELFGVTQPNEITQPMLAKINSELKKRSLDQKYDERYVTEMASEEAAATIAERETGVRGTGPTQREVQKRATLAETAPIDPKLRAELGVPKDMKTYLDVIKSGKRLMTKQDQDNVDRIESIVLVMGQLEKNAKMIFTSGADHVSRFKHGVFLKAETLQGTNIGIAVQNYQDQRETVVRLLLELVGESGGRFTDKDMSQIQKAIPGIEGLVGDMLQFLPESKEVATNKFLNMSDLLLRKLSFIKAPQLVTTQPEKPKYRITKDGKVEKK
jgi:hypothetical protein